MPYIAGLVEMKRKRPRSRTAGRQQREEAELRRALVAVKKLPRLRDKYGATGLNRRQRANAKVRAETAPSDETTEDDAVSTAIAYNSKHFSDLPLSKKTLDALAASSFTELTDVQRLAIPQALAGRDVLTAAPTGSGKTLAFVVPLIEVLWRAKWSSLDGLGGLVLSPTRELAMQIFEVLCKLAKFHGFTAGACTGGTNIGLERNVIGRLNILVATPGRLLQHMDEAPEFDCAQLQILVLDEADRILDMGFKDTVDAIVANFPKRSRQTLLFSATQTKSIRALSRLSLSNPEYVAVHSLRRDSTNDNDENEPENRETNDQLRIAGMPSNLVQTYAIVDVDRKLSVVWSFLRTHLKEKIILFFSSCKQVRFVYEAFRRMRPGFPLLQLHGKMKQQNRVDTYKRFAAHRNAALFATDIAARGLDFPSVDWVLQVDCPPDVESYVHRVGRTARFQATGRALLLLNRGSEELFADRLKKRNILPKRAGINSKRIVGIEKKLASICASFQEVQHLAKRAVVSYLRALDLRGDADVFDARSVDSEALSASYGLPVAPKVTFRERQSKKVVPKRTKRNVYGYHPFENDTSLTKVETEEQHRPKENALEGGKEQGDGSDFLMLKKVHTVDKEAIAKSVVDSDLSRSRPKRKRTESQKILWNDNGDQIVQTDVESDSEDFETNEDPEYGVEENVASVRKRLRRAEDEIRMREKNRIRKLRTRRKSLDRPQLEKSNEFEAGTVLGETDEHDESYGESEMSSEETDEFKKDAFEGDMSKNALQILEAR